jgi:hypothetical protein
MNTATLKVARYISRKIKNGAELMKEYPEYRDEYLEETLEYSKILYQIMKEVTLP